MGLTFNRLPLKEFGIELNMKGIVFCIIQTLFLIQNFRGTRSEICPLDDDFRRSYIGLASTPKMKSNGNEIKIIWENEKFKEGDRIVLLTYEESTGFKEVYEFEPKTPHGIEATGITALTNDSVASIFTEQCKKYYVAWIRNGYIRDVNCISNQPTWMFDRRDLLGNQTLADIFIPGTHNSGAYDIRTTFNWVEILVKPYVLAQDENIFTQLVRGIRYIHVKVGHHPDDRQSPWWIHVGDVPTVPLDAVIDDVERFLNRTREIVIFDVEQFAFGFKNRNTYEYLIQHLLRRFAIYILPVEFDWDTTLSQIWNYSRSEDDPKTGKVILNFNPDGTPYPFLNLRTSSIKHYSGKANDSSGFYPELDQVERLPKRPDVSAPRATFVELGIRFFVSIAEPFTLQNEADRINADISLWYHMFWHDVANIVAVDFLETSGIVDVAIRSNEYRFSDYVSKVVPSNCTKPYKLSNYSFESLVNAPAVKSILVPRIENNAAEKIYQLFSRPLRVSSPSAQFGFDDEDLDPDGRPAQYVL